MELLIKNANSNVEMNDALTLHRSNKKRVKDFRQSLLSHEEQFHLLLAGVTFTTTGKHKEQGCEQGQIFIWGFLVQNSDKNMNKCKFHLVCI